MKVQSFIIGFFCAVLGWKARERFEHEKKERRRGAWSNSQPITEQTDFYGGIGNTQKDKFSNIF